MLHLIPLAFASLMALIDAFGLFLIKGYSIGQFTWNNTIPLSMILYSCHPLIFLQSLQYETMTVMNLLLNLISDISVAAIGLLYYKESLTNIKKLGLMFAFIGIILMSWDTLNGNK